MNAPLEQAEYTHLSRQSFAKDLQGNLLQARIHTGTSDALLREKAPGLSEATIRRIEDGDILAVSLGDLLTYSTAIGVNDFGINVRVYSGIASFLDDAYLEGDDMGEPDEVEDACIAGTCAY